MKCLTLIFSLPVLVNICDAAKILAVFPLPSISHQVVFRPITQELIKRGHELTVITTDPIFSKDEALRNLTEIDVHDISYEMWAAKFYKLSTGNTDDIYDQTRIGFQLITEVVEAQLKLEKVSDLFKLKSDYFDLLIIEGLARPAYVYTHFFKAPAVMISSFGIYGEQFDIFGIPTHYTLYPTMVHQKLNGLSLWEKFSEVNRDIRLLKVMADHVSVEDEMLKKNLGSQVPALKELQNNFDMFFVNEYPIWDTNRPVPPNVIYAGGLQNKPAKELPQDLKKYLADSKNGVIYISFGTNVSPSLLPAEKLRMMVNVVSTLPYNVLWKYDKDKLPGQSKNIRVGKWFPQSDLLRHPSIKLFITQGGLQSTDEAITAGVPLLGMPLLGDQWFNVEKYITLNIGQRLDMESLTEEKFKNAIETLINTKSYRENLKNLRDRMHDQPMSSVDKVVWWMEYVIRHKGAKHLRSPAAGISWSEYLELPLVFTVLSVVLSATVVALFAIAFVLKRLSSTNEKVKTI